MVNVFKAFVAVQIVSTMTHRSHAFSSSSFSFLAKSRTQIISSFGLLPLNAHGNNQMAKSIKRKHPQSESNEVSNELKDFVEKYKKDDTFLGELGEVIEEFGETGTEKNTDMLDKFLGTILRDGILDKSALEKSSKQLKGYKSLVSGAGGGTSTNNNEEEDPKLDSSQLVARMKKYVNPKALDRMVVTGYTAELDTDELKWT